MDFHTWNTFADIWIPCQHRIHWEVVFFFFFEDKMSNNYVLRPYGIPSTDFDQMKSEFHGTKLYLKTVKSWRPLKSTVRLMHTFISVTTFKRRWPAAWENPLVGLQREHNVPAQKDSGLTCHSIWYKCFDQPGKWTVFFSPHSQSWNHRLHLANILTAEAANNCLHSETENQT